MNSRTSTIAPTTRNPISNRLPRLSDRPRCENSAARPRPAAMPAIGPSQRDVRDAAPVAPAAAAAGAAAAAVGAAAVAPGLAGMTGLVAGPEKLLPVEGAVLAA